MSVLYSYADLPRTGLCNMLNVWARAFIWARDNSAVMLAPNWVKIGRVGPLLRRERDKRFYIGQITNQGYVSGFRKWMALSLGKRFPEGNGLIAQRGGVAYFSGQKHDIEDFLGKSVVLREELQRIANPEIVSRLAALPSHYSAVHIRQGDFAVVGLLQPLEYYVHAIELVHNANKDCPILVFSDASCDCLMQKLAEKKIDCVRIMPPNEALHDLLALVNADRLICTNGSSFSEWAAFLGGMPTWWSKIGFVIKERKFSGPINYV